MYFQVMTNLATPLVFISFISFLLLVLFSLASLSFYCLHYSEGMSVCAPLLTLCHFLLIWFHLGCLQIVCMFLESM